MQYLPVLLILILTACKCPKKAMESTPSEQQPPVQMTLILADYYGGAEEEELRVIRSQGELQKFFSQVNKTRKPGLPVPKVDFEGTMVLLYAPGSNHAGELPGLKVLERTDHRLHIGLETKKGQRDRTSTATTRPFMLYSMPKSDKEVVLDRAGQP